MPAGLLPKRLHSLSMLDSPDGSQAIIISRLGPAAVSEPPLEFLESAAGEELCLFHPIVALDPAAECAEVRIDFADFCRSPAGDLIEPANTQ